MTAELSAPPPPIMSRWERARSMSFEVLAGACAFGAVVGPSWLLAPAAVGIGSCFIAGRMRNQRFFDGLEPLTAGDFETAFAHYARLSRSSFKLQLRRSSFLMMGYIEKRRGRFDAALEHYARVILPNRPTDYLASCALLSSASVHALRGEPADPSELPIASETERLMAAEIALIHCRAGRYEVALEVGEAPVVPGLEQHAGHERRLYALMQALARTAIDPAAVHQPIDAAAPALPGEFDYLSRSWPELERFIASCNWPEPVHASTAALPRASISKSRRPKR